MSTVRCFPTAHRLLLHSGRRWTWQGQSEVQDVMLVQVPVTSHFPRTASRLRKRALFFWFQWCTGDSTPTATTVANGAGECCNSATPHLRRTVVCCRKSRHRPAESTNSTVQNQQSNQKPTVAQSRARQSSRLAGRAHRNGRAYRNHCRHSPGRPALGAASISKPMGAACFCPWHPTLSTATRTTVGPKSAGWTQSRPTTAFSCPTTIIQAS